MHRSRIDVFDKIFITSITTLSSHSASVLCTEFGKRCTLDISEMRYGYNHFIVGIEILGIEFFRRINNLGFAFISVFIPDFDKLVFDNLHTNSLIGQYLMEIIDLIHKIFIFFMQLVLHKAGELTQTHIDNGRSLYFGKRETFHQTGPGLFGTFRRTYDLYDFIDVIASNNETFENMGAFFGFSQIILGTPYDNLVAVIDKCLNKQFEIECNGTTFQQRDIIYTE